VKQDVFYFVDSYKVSALRHL